MNAPGRITPLSLAVLAGLLIPAVFGLAITQINLTIDKICASFIGEGVEEKSRL